jgi:DNA repair protein RadA/Sms
VQALVTGKNVVNPRRSAQGLDRGRLALVLAVLDDQLRTSFHGSDVHSVVAGGVEVAEPGADLALALALLSARSGRPLDSDIVACGELGLGGELRQVHQTERRLAEAARLGFRRAVVPATAPEAPAGIELLRARSIGDAVALVA